MFGQFILPGCPTAALLHGGWQLGGYISKLTVLNEALVYIDTNILTNLERQIKKDNITSCLIYQQDRVIFEYYKNRKSSDKLFNLHSVTKSVVSILVGIALDQGLIDGVNTPIADYFVDLPVDKQAISIGNLLTMTPGFAWGEFGEWGGTPFPMIYTKDWVNFALQQPMIALPGVEMAYNSGCSHLLSAILQRATGAKTAAYAEKMLFGPLGIREYRWYEDAKGISIGGFNLCLRPADMLKIGLLMLGQGKWAGRQIVAPEWVATSTLAHYHTYDAIGAYGYHWWILLDENLEPYDENIYFAMGYGGQYIIVSPHHQLVVTFTSELFKDTLRPLRHFREIILNQLKTPCGENPSVGL